MNVLLLLVGLLVLSGIAYRAGISRAVAQSRGDRRSLHSLPRYYGMYLALWCLLPSLLLFAGWKMAEGGIIEGLLVSSLPAESQQLEPARLGLLVNDIRNLAAGDAVSTEVDPMLERAALRYRSLRRTASTGLTVAVLALALVSVTWGWWRIAPKLRAIDKVERVIKLLLLAASTVAIFTTLGIVLSLLFEAIRFFRLVPVSELLFGLEWSPQTALRADQVAASGRFGAVPLLVGTMLISGIAMLVAVPVGLLSAMYLSEYASPNFRSVMKPVLEILAGVPTVVYGFFAALTVAPVLRGWGESLGMDVASESALAAGLVMGIMIIPFVSSLSDDFITSVPRGLREASLGLGATRSETIRKVVFPAALPGIVGGVLLAVSRAIGETMIVVMAAGLGANLTVNPLEAVTTVTVQIVTLLVGDQEFDSAKTLAAFALGLLLFVVTLIFNVVALVVVRRYREQYE
jgi:phosphate transport system permease protein